MGYAESSALELLLIQQVTLCWPNLTEYRHTNVMKIDHASPQACITIYDPRIQTTVTQLVIPALGGGLSHRLAALIR